MMSKIRNLIQKFRKRQPEENLTGEHYIDVEHDAELEEDTGDVPPPNMAAAEDDTGEVPSAEALRQGDFENSSNSIGDNSIEEIDWENAKLSWRDRLQLGTRSLKDKIGRFNFRKFKALKVSEAEEEQEPSSKQKLALLAKTKINKIDSRKLRVLHHELFNPSRRNQIHKIFQFAVIFASVFIVGKNLALFVKGADTGQALVPGASDLAELDESRMLTRDQLNTVKDSGLFKTETTAPVDTAKKPVIAQDVKCKEANKKSSLPIQLLNTVVLQDSIKSIASVQVRSGQELTQLREGDKIGAMAKIDKIDRQKIIVKNLQDGNCEVIVNQSDFSRSSPIAVMSPRQSKEFAKNKGKLEGVENDGNTYTIEKTFIQEKMKNISDILTQARGIQLTNPDGSLSFKIVDVEPGGVFSYLGIQNNDIITHINGKKITNLNEVMSLFGKISNVDGMNITISRGGEEVPLDYKIR